ncbi:myristoylated alanine-rich C-kinase substrate-like [Macrobrachium nipponense]|uniref:myristoylated alanine-rich C-kinase substrate-like n=1 Tax=Macrobrachium nipponense TaxID=159736 RepID=UPI0030C7B1B0
MERVWSYVRAGALIQYKGSIVGVLRDIRKHLGGLQPRDIDEYLSELDREHVASPHFDGGWSSSDEDSSPDESEDEYMPPMSARRASQGEGRSSESDEGWTEDPTPPNLHPFTATPGITVPVPLTVLGFIHLFLKRELLEYLVLQRLQPEGHTRNNSDRLILVRTVLDYIREPEGGHRSSSNTSFSWPSKMPTYYLPLEERADRRANFARPAAAPAAAAPADNAPADDAPAAAAPADDAPAAAAPADDAPAAASPCCRAPPPLLTTPLLLPAPPSPLLVG